MTQATSTENVVQEIRRKTRRARAVGAVLARPGRPTGRRGPGVSPAGPVLEWRGASWTKKAPKNTETGLAAGFAPSSRRNRGDEEI